jgi:hypothetical protein
MITLHMLSWHFLLNLVDIIARLRRLNYCVGTLQQIKGE